MPASIAGRNREASRSPARRTGRTKAYYIREMILEKIDDVEDYYLAADVLSQVRKGGMELLTPTR